MVNYILLSKRRNNFPFGTFAFSIYERLHFSQKNRKGFYTRIILRALSFFVHPSFPIVSLPPSEVESRKIDVTKVVLHSIVEKFDTRSTRNIFLMVNSRKEVVRNAFNRPKCFPFLYRDGISSLPNGFPLFHEIFHRPSQLNLSCYPLFSSNFFLP